MSNTIDQAFVDQFTSNFFHLSQQKGSRLRPFVRMETQRGKAAFFERIGLVEAIEKIPHDSIGESQIIYDRLKYVLNQTPSQSIADIEQSGVEKFVVDAVDRMEKDLEVIDVGKVEVKASILSFKYYYADYYKKHAQALKQPEQEPK